jgi:hypothetical protein
VAGEAFVLQQRADVVIVGDLFAAFLGMKERGGEGRAGQRDEGGFGHGGFEKLGKTYAPGMAELSHQLVREREMDSVIHFSNPTS